VRRSVERLSILIGFAILAHAMPLVAEEAGQAESAGGAESEASSDAATSYSSPPPPIGVRFGEPLEGERFRLAYSFERIKKQGLMSGTRDRSASQVLPPNSFHPYDRTPRSLNITVHNFQLAYSPHPRVTLVVEVPFVQRELETMLDTGVRFEDQTEGVGDIDFALVLPFIRKRNESSHVHVAVKAPTGSIRRGGDDTRLPYDLQPGNGTVDLEWGWTYRGEMDWLSWGGQAWGRHPIGRNGLSYREGSLFEASLWTGARIWKGLSGSLRLSWEKQNNTRQHHSPSEPITDPSDNSKARGGTRLAVNPGITLDLVSLGHQRLAIEAEIPFYQDLSGPQLEKDWSVKAGWQWGF
jgi:hypothetical protein